MPPMAASSHRCLDVPPSTAPVHGRSRRICHTARQEDFLQRRPLSSPPRIYRRRRWRRLKRGSSAMLIRAAAGWGAKTTIALGLIRSPLFVGSVVMRCLAEQLRLPWTRSTKTGWAWGLGAEEEKASSGTSSVGIKHTGGGWHERGLCVPNEPIMR
uniref:Uncharacterized protein n=1 Tax=Oryza meridionalis TaxID=40149 RepID=A0A0E0EFQ5_9ORYZ